MNQRKFEKPVPILPLQKNVMTDYSTGFTIKRVPGGLLRIDLFKGLPFETSFYVPQNFWNSLTNEEKWREVNIERQIILERQKIVEGIRRERGW